MADTEIPDCPRLRDNITPPLPLPLNIEMLWLATYSIFPSCYSLDAPTTSCRCYLRIHIFTKKSYQLNPPILFLNTSFWVQKHHFKTKINDNFYLILEHFNRLSWFDKNSKFSSYRTRDPGQRWGPPRRCVSGVRPGSSSMFCAQWQHFGKPVGRFPYH